jgi:beta-mannosidase
MRKKPALFSPWTLSFKHPSGRHRRISSVVPGNIGADLMREKILPDLYFGANALLSQEWERTDFTYSTSFESPSFQKGERVELVFDGVDTVATVVLNGKKAGQLNNMFVPHVIDVTDALVKKGTNALSIKIHNIIDAAARNAREWGTSAFEMGHYQDKTGIFVRKAQHMFGWDIAPRILFGGIWRKVSLRIRKRNEIIPEDFHFGVRSIDPVRHRAEISLEWGCTLEPSIDTRRYTIDIQGVCGESTFRFHTRLRSPYGNAYIGVRNPLLWWPAGYGEQPLYNVTVTLLLDDKPVDEYKTRTGIRTIHLDFNHDPADVSKNRCTFIVNGTPVAVRGSNWVPVDALHSCDAERVPDIFRLFKESHCNILRCWGGSVYEEDTLFDLCDEYGIMVWQDFAFACAIYPQNKEFQDLVAEEAKIIIKKLRNHPSLALWSGDNEIDLFVYYLYGMPTILPSDNLISRRVLKEAVAQYDMYRSYLPSSPYFPDDVYLARQPDGMPEQHIWGPRGYFKDDFYAKNTAIIASEIGYHGMPAKKSIQKFLSKDKVWGSYNNDEWIVHAADFTGSGEAGPMGRRNYLMQSQVKHLFGESVRMNDMDEFILASQITQAEAFKFFIELFRGDKPQRSGILWWNMIDCWPQFSDAVVDYYFERKLAYDYISRVQEPVCVLIVERADRLEIIAVNDTLKDVSGEWRIIDVVTSVPVVSGDYAIASNGKAVLGDLGKNSAQTFFRIEWKCAGKNCYNHYVCGGAPWDFSAYCKAMEHFGLSKR